MKQKMPWSYPSSNQITWVTLQNRTLTIPMWSLFLIAPSLPTWVFFRNRRKERWRLRKDIRWISPRLHSRIVRFALFSTAGAVAGILVSCFESQLSLIHTNWEGTLPFIVLLPTVCLLVFLTRRRIPFHKALLWMSLEIAGATCFYSFATERTWHHFGEYGFAEQDTPQMILFLGFTAFVCAAIMLFFFQLKPEPVKPGPYCPQCGYCLIGSPRQICSECGRPFTHDELGVTPEALIPSATVPLTTG